MNVSDYDTLEAKVNLLLPKTFFWTKYPSSSGTGVVVMATLEARAPKTPGNQATGFYSSVILNMEEEYV